MTRQNKISKVGVRFEGGVGFHTRKEDFGGWYTRIMNSFGCFREQVHIDLYKK